MVENVVTGMVAANYTGLALRDWWITEVCVGGVSARTDNLELLT